MAAIDIRSPNEGGTPPITRTSRRYTPSHLNPPHRQNSSPKGNSPLNGTGTPPIVERERNERGIDDGGIIEEPPIERENIETVPPPVIEIGRLLKCKEFIDNLSNHKLVIIMFATLSSFNIIAGILVSQLEYKGGYWQDTFLKSIPRFSYALYAISLWTLGQLVYPVVRERTGGVKKMPSHYNMRWAFLFAFVYFLEAALSFFLMEALPQIIVKPPENISCIVINILS